MLLWMEDEGRMFEEPLVSCNRAGIGSILRFGGAMIWMSSDWHL